MLMRFFVAFGRRGVTVTGDRRHLILGKSRFPEAKSRFARAREPLCPCQRATLPMRWQRPDYIL